VADVKANVTDGGGARVDGNANTGGGDFVGRDAPRTNVSVSLENNEHLLMLRSQLSRREDTLNWRLATIEREIFEMKQDALKNAVPTWFQFIVILVVLMVIGIIFYSLLSYGVFVALRSGIIK